MGAAASIVLTGFGLSTSIGNDAVQTAAAARAGINRFARGRWSPFTVFMPEAVAVAAVPPDDPDPTFQVRLPFLLDRPTREALWAARLFDLGAEVGAPRVAAFWALPSRDRFRSEADDAEAALRSWVDPSSALAQVPAQHLELRDHAAGAVAMAAACDALRAGRCEAALVLGADSWLRRSDLEALQHADRLKLPGHADGLIPGEAGAALVLETEEGARRRRVRTFARIGHVVRRDEPAPIGPRTPARAGALSLVLRELFAREPPAAFHRVLVDLSGERWRSLEWAIVEGQVTGLLPRGWELWHPADCLGDIGAASVLASIVLVARAFERRYAGPGGALVVSSSFAGERCAVAIHPPS
jgi:3-oxoacyl-[acyl-carrier-protein] synthase I